MKKYLIFLYLILVMFIMSCGENASTNKTINTVDYSEQNFKWKMITTWPANFPIFQEGAERFADAPHGEKRCGIVHH